jgi:molecular chaperone GrpE
MTEPAAPRAEDLAQLGRTVEDLARVIARQATMLERMADEAKARAARDRTGADLPLVVELFAAHSDTSACANTAESARERSAFEAIAARIERLIVGRGGSLVTPRPGDAFDSLTMEASDITKTARPELDRTVAALTQPGLTVAGRSIRPAGVIVRRYESTTSGAPTSTAGTA